MDNFSQNSIFSYLGDKNPLGLSAVEQNSSFIATFKGIAGSDPEVINNSSYFITYIVDAQGNLNKIADNSDAQRNFVQNFSLGQEVVVRIDQGTLLNPQLDGEHVITGLGSFIPILLTQTGSGPDDGLDAIYFLNYNQQINDDINSYQGSIFASQSLDFSFTDQYGVVTSNLGPPLGPTGELTGQGIYAAFAQVGSFLELKSWLTASSPDSAAAFWTGSNAGDNPADYANNRSMGHYVLEDPQPSLTFSTIQVKTSLKTINFNAAPTQLTVALFRIRAWGDELGSDYTLLGSQQFTLTPATNDIVGEVLTSAEDTNEFIYPLSTNEVRAGDRLAVRIGVGGAVIYEEDPAFFGEPGIADVEFYNEAQNIFLASSTKQFIGGAEVNVPDLTVQFTNQNPTKANISDYELNQFPHFTTSSTSRNVLTSSLNLSSNYGNVQVTPTASEDFGFSPINSEFLLIPGDKIRFGFNTDLTFTIYEITPPESVGDSIYLKLDREVPEGLNINNFILYRNLEDGKFITLDVKRNNPQAGEQEFTGLIIPKYATQELKDNVESILLKLKEDGIIED